MIQGIATAMNVFPITMRLIFLGLISTKLALAITSALPSIPNKTIPTIKKVIPWFAERRMHS
jgi:hypothetical protein